MVDIYLNAVLPNGEEENVGQIHMERVPQANEYIMLWLHIGYQLLPGQESPDTHVMRFRVREVTTIAHNTLQTETWFTPHTPETSNYVEVLVAPENDEARRYLERLVREEAQE